MFTGFFGPVEPETENMTGCTGKSEDSIQMSEVRDSLKSEIGRLIEGFAAWLRAANRSLRTIETYTQGLGYWRRYVCNHLRLDDFGAVTPQIAAGYQSWLYETRTKRGRPLSLSYQVDLLCILKQFYRYLLKTGAVLSDPTTAIHLPKESRRLPANTMTGNEIRRILRQPDTTTAVGFRDRTILEVLYATGLRVTEVIRLRVQDFSSTAQTLKVHGKGDQERLVPVGAIAGQYLAEYIKKVRPLLLNGHARDDIFISLRGRKMIRRNIAVRVREYAAEAGIDKRITPHTFRHTLATEMLKHGADLRQVQEMLGHEHLKTTQRYTHIVKADLKRVQGKCHPREQTNLPDGFVKYRGRSYVTPWEKQKEEYPIRKAKQSCET